MNLRIVNNSILYTLGSLLPQLLSFLLLPVYTSYLSQSDYGVMAYVSAVILYVQLVGTLSVNAYLMRFYFLATSEVEKKRLVGNVFLFIFSTNLITVLAFYVLGPMAISAAGIAIPFQPYFSVALLASFFDVFSLFPQILFRVKEQAGRFLLLTLGTVILKYVISLYLIINLGTGVVGKFYADLVVNGVAFLLYLVLIVRNVKFVVDWHQIREAVSFSLPFLVSSLLYLVVDSSDRFFLERNTTLAALGVYSIAVTFASGLSSLTQSMYRAFEPSVYKAWGTSRFDAAIGAIKKYFFAATGAVSLGLCLFLVECVSLLTHGGFELSGRVGPVLMLASAFAAIRLFFDTILIAHKKSSWILAETALGGALSLALNAALIPFFGIWGAATAKLLTFASMGCVSYFLVAKLSGGGSWEDVKSIVAPLAIAASGIGVAAWFGGSQLANISGFLIKIVYFAVGTTAILVVTGVWPEILRGLHRLRLKFRGE